MEADKTLVSASCAFAYEAYRCLVTSNSIPNIYYALDMIDCAIYPRPRTPVPDVRAEPDYGYRITPDGVLSLLVGLCRQRTKVECVIELLDFL